MPEGKTTFSDPSRLNLNGSWPLASHLLASEAPFARPSTLIIIIIIIIIFFFFFFFFHQTAAIAVEACDWTSHEAPMENTAKENTSSSSSANSPQQTSRPDPQTPTTHRWGKRCPTCAASHRVDSGGDQRCKGRRPRAYGVGQGARSVEEQRAAVSERCEPGEPGVLWAL